MKSFSVLFFCVLPVLIVNAQPVFYDSKAPQVSFGASEIRHAFAPSAPSADRAIRDLASDTSPVRFVIAPFLLPRSGAAGPVSARRRHELSLRAYGYRGRMGMNPVNP